MKTFRFVAAAAALAAAVTMSACGGDDEPATRKETSITTLQQDAKSQNWPSQAKLLADGQVSKEDLTTAFSEFRDCVASYGLSVSDPVVNRVDGWRLLADINYNGVTDQKTIEAANGCSASKMSLIEAGYEITHQAQMDQPLMGYVRDCLTKRGIATTGSEQNVADLVKNDDTRFDAVQTCIQAGGHALYPSEPLTITN